MKTFFRTCLLSFLLLSLLETSAQVDSARLTASIRAGMDSVQTSFKKRDWIMFTNLMHPQIIKMVGSKASFVKLMEQQMASMQDATIDSLMLGNVLQIVKYKNEWQCVVESFMQMTVDTTTVSMCSSNIGISADDGKSWKFIRVSNGGEKKIKALITGLSPELKIPLNQTRLGTLHQLLDGFEVKYPAQN